MLTNEEYKEITGAAELQALDSLWAYSIPDNRSPENFSFSERKEVFFYLLEKLLQEGRIRLAKNGVFLEGKLKEQVEMLRSRFPKNEIEMNDGAWFFYDRCPGGAVWFLPGRPPEWT
ncbi:DUF596 domain-containing protein [Mixta intestinalis]|uniref:DUF596 domain-containing protein n=1 Tax=Mixta intestinalis TaxID=1615494 RepID=A0A6P1Q2V8_9GAMM|nr:DUF596 domain-containing protein [Mixta intestinalis]QHM73246.1 hypothetical protein C7M51_03591 [Mixta intestinalis]